MDNNLHLHNINPTEDKTDKREQLMGQFIEALRDQQQTNRALRDSIIALTEMQKEFKDEIFSKLDELVNKKAPSVIDLMDRMMKKLEMPQPVPNPDPYAEAMKFAPRPMASQNYSDPFGTSMRPPTHFDRIGPNSVHTTTLETAIQQMQFLALNYPVSSNVAVLGALINQIEFEKYFKLCSTCSMYVRNSSHFYTAANKQFTITLYLATLPPQNAFRANSDPIGAEEIEFNNRAGILSRSHTRDRVTHLQFGNDYIARISLYTNTHGV